MPRVVRNFWVDLSVDGRKPDISTGPKRGDGELSLTLSQNHDGEVRQVLKVESEVKPNGRLITFVSVNNSEQAYNNQWEQVAEIITQRPMPAIEGVAKTMKKKTATGVDRCTALLAWTTFKNMSDLFTREELAKLWSEMLVEKL